MGFDTGDVQSRRPALIFIPQDEESLRAVVQFVAERVIDFNPAATQAALASVKDGKIVGAVVYQNYRTTDIEMVCAGEPGWLNRSVLRAYFDYPFAQLGCVRATAICHIKNKKARKFVEKIGFRMEGKHPKAMPDGRDAISYGLLRSECKWL